MSDFKASSTWQTFKHRDEWIRLLLAAEPEALSYPAKAVGACIALHHNINTGQCNPPVGMLVRESGMSNRNVRRMLRELEQAGWLITDLTSGGRRSSDTYTSNSFELTVPLTRTNVSALNPDNVVRVKKSNPDKPGRLTRTSRVFNPDTVVRQKENLITAKDNSEDIDSARLLDLDEKEDGHREANPSSPPDTTNADFESWYRQYPKHVARAAALKAYRTVIGKRLATPEQLLNGAMRYAAERSNQDPKYTKHASTWLAGGCWDDEPAKPIGGTYSSAGPPGRPDHAAVAEQIARQLMEKDGAHVIQ
jgi:hypothetical protein